MAAASSSSQPKKYDVFVSFRGSDVRKRFLSHLRKALKEKGVDVFVDEKLERGEDISVSLLETIEQSFLALVIFSQNYAYSQWCLDELLKIQQCKKTMGQIVIPVFYEVDPDDVQELRGNFGDAIAEHKKQNSGSLKKKKKKEKSTGGVQGWCQALKEIAKLSTVISSKDESSKRKGKREEISNGRLQDWCQALKEVANLSGVVSGKDEPDTELINKIINHILEKLNIVIPSDHSLVGIDSRVKCVESLLHLELEDVRVIGIWGMGGIGKTTIAKQVFDRIRNQFTAQCFKADVREMSENKTIDCLQSEVFCELLGIANTSASTTSLLAPFNRNRLARKAVLIVLDDVSDLKQVELLIGKIVKYGPCSRIIMTSRDKQVLKNGGAEIYEVEGLNMHEALQIFCSHAFDKNAPEEGYGMLTKRAVVYAEGLPLALKVLGSNLYGKSAEEWEDELKKLQDTSDDTIQKILRISYDGLWENDKEIFLDIACFCKGKDRDYVERILGVGSKIGISRLIDKSLISVSNYNKELHIHDLIEQMGKDIICEEKQLGRRSRLWHHEDICYVLTKNKGTEAIRGISLDLYRIKDVQLRPEAFEGMVNLRFLKFSCIGNYYYYLDSVPVHLPKGLKFLSGKLRSLQWDECALESLPIGFCAANLVELCLRRSKLKELWNGVQLLENLKVIDLRRSKYLIRLPDLSRALNLEKLYLNECRSLVEIPSSLKYLSNLTELDLSGCYSLCNLPSCFHSDKLETLFLSNCSKIKELPAIPCHKRHNKTAISQVPTSFPILPELRLSGCSKLRTLPDNICSLKCLRRLDISFCESLHALPENLGNVSSLEELIANGSGIERLSDTICSLKNLKNLDVSGCVKLAALPEKLGDLASLRKLNARRTGISYLPDLPISLKELDVSDCASLKSASGSFHSFRRLKICRFMNCVNLGEDKSSKIVELAVERLFCFKTKTENRLRNSLKLCVPGSRVMEKMKYKNKSGSSLSLCLSQLERWSDIRALYFCAVLDPNFFPRIFGGGLYGKINCEIIASAKKKKNKSNIYSMDYQGKWSSKHVFLWCQEFNSDESLPNPIVFSFFYSSRALWHFCRSDAIHEIKRCDDGIIECGVHPVFYDDMLSVDDDDDGCRLSSSDDDDDGCRLSSSDDDDDDCSLPSSDPKSVAE